MAAVCDGFRGGRSLLDQRRERSWCVASGLEPERIYAIHRAGLVSEANLEEIRRGMAADGERTKNGK
jgi:hypothetical protein